MNKELLNELDIWKQRVKQPYEAKKLVDENANLKKEIEKLNIINEEFITNMHLEKKAKDK